MSEREGIVFDLEVNTANMDTQLAELNDLLTTYIALARKSGLPPEVLKAIRLLQQLRVAAEMAYKSIMMMYMGAGPVGWLMGFGGMATSLFIYSDTLTEMQG